MENEILDLIKYISTTDKDAKFRNICSLIKKDYYFLSDLESRNIVVPAKNKNDKVVLTAHYDVYPNSMGYNDNSTSIVALLLMHDLLPDFCEIVFTDNEERFGKGADLYLKYNYDKIRFNINIDVIGIGKKIFYELYDSTFYSSNIKSILTEPEEHKGIPFSDSYIFYKYQILSLLFVAGNSNYTVVSDIFKCIHNNVDDNKIELINPLNVNKVINYTLNVLKNFK